MISENRQKIHELVDACLDANGLKPRTRKVSDYLPTIFFTFSGHIGVFEIQVHANGWEPGDIEDKRYWLNVDEEIPESVVQDIKLYLSDVSNKKDIASVIATDIAKKEKEIKSLQQEIDEKREALKKMEENHEENGNG